MSKIRKIGDQILRKQTEPVTDFSQLPTLIKEMTEIMREEKGIGLAANQAGVSKAVCIIDTSYGINPIEIFVNPKIMSTSDLIDFEEGCLSIPGISATIKRFNKVKVQYQNLVGEKQEQEMEGLSAIAIQHEIDHLNGKLYVDHLSRLKKSTLLAKYRKMYGFK